MEAIRTDISKRSEALKVINDEAAELQRKLSDVQQRRSALVSRVASLKEEEKRNLHLLQQQNTIKADEEQKAALVAKLNKELQQLQSEVCGPYSLKGFRELV